MGNSINVKMIEDFIKEKGLNKTKFCKMCKISYCTLKAILKNGSNFRISALFKIARVMSREVCEMFI